ncbi:probable ubiquitin-conjugating enzyme E2 26 [Lycium ferocissimum]|uniref:probable ubiquitin-conjugating enzyme E2 26 n=1 Tax=Lycium ferocissimum TaxID=112874 RepID=UPI0028164E15|nr:probable ubiquitin-conjugating enzyme E2 26 [Lycium ferocissimum]
METRYVSQNSKKRVFPGGSSIDAEVVEISRPANWSSKSKSPKQKEVIFHEIIDIDVDEDCSDVNRVDGNVESSGKGKDILVGGPVDGVQSSKNNCPSASDNPIVLDDFGYDDLLYDDSLYDDYSVLQSHFDYMDIPTGVEATIPWMSGPIKEQTVSTTTSTSGRVVGSSNEKSFEGVNSSKIHSSGATATLDWHNQSKIYEESLSQYGKKIGSSDATASYGWGNQSIPPSGSYFSKYPMGPTPMSDWTNVLLNQTTPVSSEFTHASGSMNYFPQSLHKSAATAASPSIPSGQLGETLKKFRLFKKFDTVDDHSDHHYSKQASSGNQPPKNWAKKIQEEWKILEKDLPDTIFVRVYESRMDLLRAVIMGADGTPYHDGLFFFDVFFPSNYPNVPPLVHYHSFGLRINPNLYNCGKVCLSLLNTWSGKGKEKWMPRSSTMLQVLVSIQGLILNAKPYFNEPGHASSEGTKRGDESSLRYSENTFILNLKTMVFSMRRPPKHFEDFVIGHFFQSAQDILVACKAYTEGAQVGSLVRGGVQDVDEGDKSCSPTFKASLAGFIKTVIDTFKEIGARDCDKFLPLAQIGTGGVVPVVPANASYYYG